MWPRIKRRSALGPGLSRVIWKRERFQAGSWLKVSRRTPNLIWLPEQGPADKKR